MAITNSKEGNVIRNQNSGFKSWLEVKLNGEWHQLTSYVCEEDWFSKPERAKVEAEGQLRKQMHRWRAADQKYADAEMRIVHPV
jgi:hypothetical protein